MDIASAKLGVAAATDSGSSAHRPLKVCLVVDTLELDAGTEKLVANLANSFDPQVLETHVCCFEPGSRLSRLRPWVRTAVFPLQSIHSITGLKQLWRFRAYLQQHGIEVVHSFMTKSAIFSVLAAQGTACKAIITSRLNTGYWYTAKLRWAFRVLDRYSTHIVANSLIAKELTVNAEKVSAAKIAVFYPGVDLQHFAAGDPSTPARLGIPADAPVVGIVANFRPVKDLPLFLRAARLISSAVPSAAFLLVGQGSLKAELQQLAATLGVEERVFFSSPDVAVRDYLARMSVACLSSESEGLPNAILEYMAAGLPVVATDVGGVSELIQDGASGYLVKTRTPECFAEPIIRLLRDEHLRIAMGKRGLERARSEFDRVAAVQWLQRFYLDAASSVQSG